MSFMGSVGMGPGLSAGRFGQTRGRMQGSMMNGVNYPSPFFDVAQTYLPQSVKALFRWCRYYFLTNPLINATVFKLAEYPVTDIIIDHESADVVRLWTEYLQDNLRYRPFQIECGLDYFTYGNSFDSMGFPFKKYLHCKQCEFREQANKVRSHWVFTNHAFRLTCPKCGNVGDAEIQDFYFKNASGIKMIRWNPEDIEINYNDLSGESTYFYTVPPAIKNDVVVGRKEVVEGIPQVFIQAMKENRGVIFSKDNFFHMRRPTLANQDRGWGIPLLLPVLKDTFYLQIMKKAQEAILLEHIVPLRVLFPQAGSGSSDPYTTINLVDWKDHVAQEIARWRYDNNYIPILPLPIGQQTIGGDGKALLLTQEIQQHCEGIMVGMGVPREFLMGGMSYAGTNVSMRMLENAFLGYINRQTALLRFTMKQVANFMGWPEIRKVRFKPFKMADDIQRKSFEFQLNQAQKISDTTLLASSDYSQEAENEIMIKETASRLEATKKQQLATAEIQGEAQLIAAKYQAKAQQEMAKAQQAPVAPGEPGGAEGAVDPSAQGQPLADPSELPQPPTPQQGPAPTSFLQMIGSQLTGEQRTAPGSLNSDPQSLAMAWARQLSQLPPEQQQAAITNLQTQSPELAQLVQQMLARLAPKSATGPQVDMRPLPEQRSPRRANGVV